MLKVFHISLADIFGSYNLLFCIISTVITYFLTFFIGELLKKRYHISSLTLPIPVYLLSLSLLGISVVMFVFNIVSGQQAGYTPDNLAFNAILIIIYSLVTFCILLIMIRYIQRDARTKSMLEQYHNLKHYTDELERMNLGFRTFRHDYIDILTSLSDYIENNDMARLRRTFEEQIAPLGNNLNTSMSRLSSLSHLKIPELKALISSKILYAQSQNLNVSLDIIEDISQIPMDLIDLIRIIGIFFNNATEELLSANVEPKDLEFGIIKKQDCIVLVIRNSTLADKSILPLIYNLDYSSKGEHRGLGLYTVRKILSGYKNVIHHTSIENSVFTQVLELYF